MDLAPARALLELWSKQERCTTQLRVAIWDVQKTVADHTVSSLQALVTGARRLLTGSGRVLEPSGVRGY